MLEGILFQNYSTIAGEIISTAVQCNRDIIYDIVVNKVVDTSRPTVIINIKF
jgi:hypothetical protein